MDIQRPEGPALAGYEIQTQNSEERKTRLALMIGSVAGVVLAASSFALHDSGPASVNAINSGERTDALAKPARSSVVAPEVAVAEAEQQIKEVVDYIQAEDEAKKRAIGDYISAKVAEDMASQAAAEEAARQQLQTSYVTSDSNPGDFLSCVRNRESGGNYGIYNAGGSGAAGAYQFLPGTWNSIAASSGREDLVGVDPAQASPADQDAMAQALYAQQGAAPWGGGC